MTVSAPGPRLRTQASNFSWRRRFACQRDRFPVRKFIVACLGGDGKTLRGRARGYKSVITWVGLLGGERVERAPLKNLASHEWFTSPVEAGDKPRAFNAATRCAVT